LTVAPIELVVPALRVRGLRRPPVLVLIALGYLLAVVFVAIFAGILAPYSPSATDLNTGLTAPSGAHWLGTDALGRDLMSQLIVGARPALWGPILIAAGAMLIGNTFGLLAGYLGGLIDTVIMRAVDAAYSVPALLVAIVVSGIFGGGYPISIVILMVLFAPHDTRIVRGAVLAQRNLPYVEAARTLGLSRKRIMVRHIWPNVMPLVVAQTCLSFAFSLVALSALAFLGIGTDLTTPSWGLLLVGGQLLIFTNPAAVMAPCAAIVLTAASMNIVGDWIFERLSDRGLAR
jgi:peptide/nickel transport system permease protein